MKQLINTTGAVFATWQFRTGLQKKKVEPYQKAELQALFNGNKEELDRKWQLASAIEKCRKLECFEKRNIFCY